MKAHSRLIIVIVLFLGIAIGFTLYLSWPLISGKTVILEILDIKLVDNPPPNELEKQYNLQYEIGQTSLINKAKIGDTVYVCLKEEDKRYLYMAAKLTKPKECNTFIKGTIKSTVFIIMKVEYGIEQVFFERNAELSRTNLTAEVKISNSGEARILKLLHNGKPIEHKILRYE